MTASHSPLRVLKAQADNIANIAKIVKAVERGDNPIEDVGGRISAARCKDSVKFAIVQDDKIISITLPWAKIRDTSEAGIAEYILKYMKGARDAVQ